MYAHSKTSRFFEVLSWKMPWEYLQNSTTVEHRIRKTEFEVFNVERRTVSSIFEIWSSKCLGNTFKSLKIRKTKPSREFSEVERQTATSSIEGFRDFIVKNALGIPSKSNSDDICRGSQGWTSNKASRILDFLISNGRWKYLQNQSTT